MQKHIHILISIVFLIFIGCNNEEKIILRKTDQISIISVLEKQDSLLIEGYNIWVRNNPRKGKVVMKLNEGSACAIIDTSKVDTIKGCIDHWYKIKNKDTIGWVFGSQTNIKSESSKETLLFLKQNNEKLKCENIDYDLISGKKEGYYSYLSSVIIFSGNTNLDTLNFQGKKVLFENKEYAKIIKKDINFDGFCDFIYTDNWTVSHGASNRYYFLYDLEKRGFIEDTSLPYRNGGIKINTIKKEVIIFCSYHDCESSYKFINKTFKKVSGEFTLEP